MNPFGIAHYSSDPLLVSAGLLAAAAVHLALDPIDLDLEVFALRESCHPLGAAHIQWDTRAHLLRIQIDTLRARARIAGCLVPGLREAQLVRSQSQS